MVQNPFLLKFLIKNLQEHLYEFAGLGEPPITYQELRNKFNIKVPNYERREFLESLYNET